MIRSRSRMRVASITFAPTTTVSGARTIAVCIAHRAVMRGRIRSPSIRWERSGITASSMAISRAGCAGRLSWLVIPSSTMDLKRSLRPNRRCLLSSFPRQREPVRDRHTARRSDLQSIYSFLMGCPPNSFLSAASILSTNESLSRERRRSSSDNVMMGAGTSSSSAAATVQRPSPESAT